MEKHHLLASPRECTHKRGQGALRIVVEYALKEPGKFRQMRDRARSLHVERNNKDS